MTNARPMLPLLAVLAILLCACGGTAPVIATKVLDLQGLEENLRAVALAPDGTWVVTSDMNGQLVGRDVPSGEERWRVAVHAPGSAASIDHVAFSPDAALLALSGNEARTVKLRDAVTGDEVVEWPIAGARAVLFHPTEPVLVIGGSGMLHVVDLESQEVARTVPDAHLGDALYAASFSADGRVLATASEHGQVKLWDWPALTVRAKVTIKPSVLEGATQPVSVALTRDGTRFAANAMQGKVHVWDPAPEMEERRFESVATAPGHWHVEMYRSLAFSDDGEWLFAPEVHDLGLRIVDVEGRESYGLIQEKVPFYKGISFARSASAVALIHPGNITGAGVNGLQVWKLAKPEG